MFDKRLTITARLLVGVVLLGLLFWWSDWQQLIAQLRKVQPLFLLPFIILFPLSLLIASRRWSLLLTPIGVDVPRLETFKLYWIGLFLSNFLPSNIGGDLSRIGLLYRFRKTTEIAGSVLTERFIGLLALLTLASVTVCLRPDLLPGNSSVYWGTLAISLLAGGALILGTKRLLSLRSLSKAPASGLTGQLVRLLQAITTYRQQSVILPVLSLSFLYYLAGFLAHYSIALALDLDLRLQDVVMITPLILLISMIPLSVNALGLAEGAFIAFYTKVGLSPSEALAFALLLRGMQMGCSAFGGLLLISRRNRGTDHRSGGAS